MVVGSIPTGRTPIMKKPLIIILVLVIAGSLCYLFLNSHKEITERDSASLQTPRTWRELIKEGTYGEKCDIKTEKVTLTASSSDPVVLAFDYTNCGLGPVKYKVMDNQIISFAEPVPGEAYYEGGYPIVDYWILQSNQSTEDFIKSLITALPTAEERDHCVVSEKTFSGALSYNNSNNKRYEIRPDEYLYKKTIRENPDGLNTFCGRYGLSNSMRFFERTGDVLLFIQAGQDLSSFDPTSFRVIK